MLKFEGDEPTEAGLTKKGKHNAKVLVLALIGEIIALAVVGLITVF